MIPDPLTRLTTQCPVCGTLMNSGITYCWPCYITEKHHEDEFQSGYPCSMCGGLSGKDIIDISFNRRYCYECDPDVDPAKIETAVNELLQWTTQ